MGGFSTVTPPPSQVSATSVAQAVWSYSPRSLTDIQSLVTAIQNNDPSLVSSLSDLMYVPVPYYAAQVTADQVASFISNLVQNYNMAGMIASFINSISYNLWQLSFVTNLIQNPYLGFTNASLILSVVSSSVLASIAMSTNVPATTILVLISNSALSATAAQNLLYSLAQNYYYNKWVYTVTANAPSITFSTNATLSTNVLIAQNITIASGVTVTCGTTTCFFVAQSFNNYGTIVNPYGATGAPSPGADIGNGGTGGGGIVVIAATATLGNLNVAGSPGGVGNSGASAAVNGGNGGAGVFYVVTGVVVPVGGSGAGAYAGPAGVNGGGGGGSSIYTGGAGGSATLYAFASANSMLTYIMQGLSDWLLIKVLGKAPSSTTPLAFMYGSGGGAGAGVGVAGNPGSGGGGGGGGEVVVYAFNVVSGTINAVGGTGGGSPQSGGGGGGGGLVFMFYGATSGNLTASVNGGIGGDIGGTGLAGAKGTAYIAQVTVNG